MRFIFLLTVVILSALSLTQSTYLNSAYANSGIEGNEANNSEEVFLAPGWGKLSFEAPAAGTYQLPPIRTAAGGELLDVDGNSLNLDSLLGEKITVLSFIYRTCDDVNGCPLSTMVSYKVASKIEENEALHDDLRLLTISFDPQHDTPEVMRDFGEDIKPNDEVDWQFLTSASDTHIKPVLDAYQQTVVADSRKGEDGARKFSHILRVYLIDRAKQIRNIYNVSFLHPDILINDVLTLIAEENNNAAAQTPSATHRP